MALESVRTLEQLREECEDRGIPVMPTGKGGKFKKEDFIHALRGDYLLERYGDPDNVPFPLTFMLTMDCPMLCKRYAQCKPDTQIAVWRNDGKYAAELKIDGCLSYDVQILLSDGTTKSIGEIVENRLSVEVMSYDIKTNSLVPRRVVNWFNHGKKPLSQWVRTIHVQDLEYHKTSHGYFTYNHAFLCVDRGTHTIDEVNRIGTFNGNYHTLDEVSKRRIEGNFIRVHKENDEFSLKTHFCAGIRSFNPYENADIETYSEDGFVAYDIEVEGLHNYVADGFVVHNSRSVLIWDSDTQSFDFYSRHNSVTDFLPISYKHNIRVFGNFHSDKSFVLDCEVIATNANTVTKKVCTSQLNSTAALLSMDAVQSMEIQKDNPLHFVIFDCLYDEKDIRSLPWKERHVHAESLAKELQDAGFHCHLNPYTLTDKRKFYEDIISRGDEGVVFKCTDAPYTSTTSRTNDMIKLKRTVACDLANDLDAWISGFTEATVGKANENYIGGLCFSCKVRQKDGTVITREIGRVAGIPQDLRIEMTDYDANGKPCLKQEYYGDVATLSGQDISGVNKRLTHCTLVAWRPDKDPDGCEILEESELEKLIL